MIKFSSNIKKSCFIITRFNLKLFSKDKKNRTTLTDQWLKERFDLFETYCYPSVKGQITQNFYWLCLFSEDTDDKYKQRINALHESYSSFIPLFLTDEETQNYFAYINHVISSLKDGSEKLITIRLDNDDSININYTKEVERLYEEQIDKEVCYSFKYGIQYYTKKNLAVRIPYSTNHFICLINKAYDSKKITNILEFNHAYPEKFPFKFCCMDNVIPMWVEVIHGRNVDNDCKMTFNQKILSNPKILMDNFEIPRRISPIQSKIGFFTFLIPAFMAQFTHRLASKLIGNK